jgi:hypothetical protein
MCVLSLCLLTTQGGCPGLSCWRPPLTLQARLHDRVVLAYHGPAAADTNFPPDAALLAEVGEAPKGLCVRSITAAIKLLKLEQGLPHAAVAAAALSPAQWAEWE